MYRVGGRAGRRLDMESSDIKLLSNICPLFGSLPLDLCKTAPEGAAFSSIMSNRWRTRRHLRQKKLRAVPEVTRTGDGKKEGQKHATNKG